MDLFDLTLQTEGHREASREHRRYLSLILSILSRRSWINSSRATATTSSWRPDSLTWPDMAWHWTLFRPCSYLFVKTPDTPPIRRRPVADAADQWQQFADRRGYPNSEGQCQLCGFLECSQRRSLESSGEIWRMSSKKHGKHMKALKPVEPFEPLRSIMKSRARAKARILPPPQCVGVPMIFSAFGASRLPSAMMSRPAKRHRSHGSHRSLAMAFWCQVLEDDRTGDGDEAEDIYRRSRMNYKEQMGFWKNLSFSALDFFTASRITFSFHFEHECSLIFNL